MAGKQGTLKRLTALEALMSRIAEKLGVDEEDEPTHDYPVSFFSPSWQPEPVHQNPAAPAPVVIQAPKPHIVHVQPPPPDPTMAAFMGAVLPALTQRALAPPAPLPPQPSPFGQLGDAMQALREMNEYMNPTPAEPSMAQQILTALVPTVGPMLAKKFGIPIPTMGAMLNDADSEDYADALTEGLAAVAGEQAGPDGADGSE